jgi:uncharacterized protein
LPKLLNSGTFLNDDCFEWDEAKAAANLKKHKIDFADACRVFNDVEAAFLADDAHQGENRFTAIGYVNGHLLAVTCTERGEATRIISARKATKHEQKAYHNQSKKA